MNYHVYGNCECARTSRTARELARTVRELTRTCAHPRTARELARTWYLRELRVFAYLPYIRVYPRIRYIRGVSAVYPCILVRVSSAYLPYIRREPVRNIRVFAYELGHVSHYLHFISLMGKKNILKVNELRNGGEARTLIPTSLRGCLGSRHTACKARYFMHDLVSACALS